MSAKFLLPATAVVCLVLAACNDNSALPTSPSGITMRPASFDVSSTGSGTGPVVSGVPLPNVCLDIQGGSATAPAPHSPLQAWQCHGGANQQFTLQANGSITAYGGQLCLDVWGAQANSGDSVVVWPCHGGINQKWTYTSAGQLQTAINGKCLDLWGAQGQNGARIDVWPCHGGYNQKWTVTVAASGGLAPRVDTSAVGSAELPRTYLNTAMPAVTGSTIAVAANGDLQAALNAAQPGDQIVLPAGATYTGSFVLPAKLGMSNTQWIVVRSSGVLPPEGTRIGPGDAAQMPKILAPNNFAPALTTSPGAQGWRITGVEISSAPGTTWNYSFVNLGSAGSDQNTAAQAPSRIVLDRSYIHGSATFDLRRCVTLNSASSAVVDSYLADCHSRANDSQAILGWNGPGPYKITNNHLEGGHEIVMFGGSDPSVANNVPADIEFRHNHVIRPTSWRGVWQAKNLLELKMGQRVLIEANVFENNWVDAQNGFAFVFSSNNQEGGCGWCLTSDVTFRSNVVRNTPNGFNLADHGVGNNGSVNASQAMRRVTITNNEVLGVDAQGGRMFQIGGDLAGITITNNTAIGGNNDVIFASSNVPLPSFVFRNNVTGGTYSLMTDDGSGGGTQIMGKLQIPGASITGNVFLNTSIGNLIPAGNVFGTAAGAGFVNMAGGDLTLSAASPYRTAGVGGTTPGADIVSLSNQTSGVAR